MGRDNEIEGTGMLEKKLRKMLATLPEDNYISIRRMIDQIFPIRPFVRSGGRRKTANVRRSYRNGQDRG